MDGALALAAQHDAAGDHDAAIDALARAANAGDVEAMTELAKRLVIGDRAPLLPEDGVRLLGDAMRAGSPEAAERLATLAALGAYTEQNWGLALRLLVRAAEQGSESAGSQLAVPFPPALDLDMDAFNIYNCKSWGYTPKTNDVCLFPSVVTHSVDPNESSEDRWCLAFNVFVRGDIGVLHKISIR